MAATPIYALPYPVPTDPADVPADIQALANRLEAVLPTIGGQLAYAENSGNTAIGTTEVTVVTAAAVTLDGSTRIKVEAMLADLVLASNAAPGAQVSFTVYDGATSLGIFALINALSAPTTNRYPLGVFSRVLTPSAGSHTYSLRATSNVAGNTLSSGAGGGTNRVPSYLRIARA